MQTNKFCFADLAKANHDLKMNIDNITLLYLYDTVREDIKFGLKHLINTIPNKERKLIPRFARLLRYITHR